MSQEEGTAQRTGAGTPTVSWLLVAVLLGPPLGGLGYTLLFTERNPAVVAVLAIALVGSFVFATVTLQLMRRGRASTLQYGIVLLAYLWFTISAGDAVVIAGPQLLGWPALISVEDLVAGVLVEGHGAFLDVVVLFFLVRLIGREPGE